MENASKALLISGGILLAIMLISLLIIIFTSAQSLSESTERTKLAEQTAEFNKGFTAYQKGVMYGTDVISVVNKAINNNRTMDSNRELAEGETYYVNIKFTTNEDFKTTYKRVDTSKNPDDGNYEKKLSSDDVKNISGLNTGGTTTLSKGDYSLGEFETKNNTQKLKMYDGIVGFFENDKEDKVVKNDKCIYYQYSALTNFKRAVFKCTGVSYDESTGRVNEMTFEQINT